MANYDNIKATINANIKTNGNQEISGSVLNSVLNQIVNTLGTGYQFAGVATTATNPGSPDAKVFYIANGKGIYTNFGGIDVMEDEVVVLYNDDEWHKESTGIASNYNLENLLIEIKNLFGGEISKNVQYNVNVLPNQDGTFYEDTSVEKNWFGSGFVEIPNGAKLVKFGGIQFTSTIITPLAFYDKDKNFISCVPYEYPDFHFIEGEIIIPANAVYIYQSLYAYSDAEKTNNPERCGDNYTIYVFKAKYDLDSIDKIKQEIGTDGISLGIESFTSDVIYRADGTTKVYGSPWVSTDFIPCVEGQKVTYKGYRYYDNTNDVAIVSFFNDIKLFISCVASSSFGQNGGNVDGSVVTPSGTAFVRLVSLSSRADSTLILDSTGLKLTKEDVAVLNGNNLKGIKACCVGDSLTQGVDVGSHIIAESYPYFMGRYLNCDIVNYGKMGETSKSWWNKFSEILLFDSSMDVVLIMFGTNGGLTTNTLSTDVEPFDDWHNYADTPVGDYCKLIESIMEQTENKTQIVLMTPPYSSYTPQQTQIVINTEPVVRSIAKRYNLPVIDVLNECGMGKFNAAIFRPHDGCHFNAKGYHKLGTFIGSRLKSMFSTFDFTDVYDDETPIS